MVHTYLEVIQEYNLMLFKITVRLAMQGGIILRGLWLEGAQWSTRGELTEQSGVQSLTALPDVLCYPTTVKEVCRKASYFRITVNLNPD